MIRRRAVAAVGVVAAAAAAVPVALAVGASGGSSIEPAQQQRIYPGLYAAPPAPGSQCNAGQGRRAATSDYPELLVLPPSTMPLTSFNIATQSLNCPPAHVALTALKLDGNAVSQAVEVEGPNAPTTREVDESGPGVHHGTPSADQPILGQAATEFGFGDSDHVDAYWTEPDGGQWHAAVKGMSETAAVALLDRLKLDSKAGTATLPDAHADGWVVEPAAADATSPSTGVMFASWTDPAGHHVTINVMQGPDRVDPFAAGGPAGAYGVEGYIGPVALATVRGHPAVVGTGSSPTLFWQESRDVQVVMTVVGGNQADAEQVAESLTLASPSDPRINTN